MGRVLVVAEKGVELLRYVPGVNDTDRFFHINLSRRYRTALIPFRALLIASCVAFALGILWNIGQAFVGLQQARTIERELDRVRQEDAQLLAQAKQEGIDLSAAALEGLPEEVNLANQLLAKRMFSWTKFLSELEQAIPAGLALSSIGLDPGGTTVHLTGTAVSLEDVTAFTVGLQDHPTFRDPVLAEHRAGSNGQVEFDITLHYRRDGV